MLRALLVGAGGMGKSWAKNLDSNSDVDLAGWIDIRPGAARAATDELGLTIRHVGISLEEAIQLLQPSFVVDVTVPEAHREVTVTSLSHGIPVLGEKPMAFSIGDAKAMVRASEMAGKLYMVSQSRRYNGSAQAYRDLVQAVGRLGMLNVDFYIGAHFGGFRDHMESPLLLDMAIHTFDMARFLSGKNPVSVYAEEFNPLWSWYDGNASAQCLFEMEDGLRFNYRGSWCAEGRQTSWEGEWRAIGDRGTATWDGHGEIRQDLVSGEDGFIRECQASSIEPKQVQEGIAGSLTEFIAALRTGTVPNGECHDNIKSLAMVVAAHESSKRGERVSIQEILHS